MAASAAFRDDGKETSSSAGNDSDTGEATVVGSEPRAGASDDLATPVTSPARRRPEAPPALQSQLILIHQPKFAKARLTLRLDGEVLWSEEIDGPKSLFGRIGRDAIERQFSVPAGDHQLEAHFEGLSRTLDATASLQGRLSSDTSRTVKITVLPRRESLELSWVDDPPALINPPPRPQ